MSTFFFDTSALAKRYLNEVGSAWVRAVLDPVAGHAIILNELTTVEMSSLLARRTREGSLPAETAAALVAGFLLHADTEYLVLPLDATVLTTARALVGRFPLRTLDAIQFASALMARSTLREPITFVSSDTHLLAAAAAEGFATEDPLVHP